MKGNIIAGIFFLGLIFVACNNNQQASNDKPAASQVSSKAAKGELIYQQNCATCHQLKIDAMGPALQGSLSRWSNDSVRLKSFIRNSGKLIADGDPRAKELYAKWKVNMTPFPGLSDEELNELMEYMK